jgi:hypothetical protein
VIAVASMETDCREFRQYFFVSVIFICESCVRGEDRLQGIKKMFVCDCDI